MAISMMTPDEAKAAVESALDAVAVAASDPNSSYPELAALISRGRNLGLIQFSW